MAGLEVVVRPVVFPNIRPQPARSLPPEDDPQKGICEIKGTSSFIVQFSFSSSWSVTYGKRKEMKRRVDEVRVYQKDDDGTVNKDNFVDIDVANKIWMQGGNGPAGDTADPGAGVGSGIDAGGGGSGQLTRPIVEVDYYRKVQEADNIEIKKRDVIKRSGEETQSGPV